MSSSWQKQVNAQMQADKMFFDIQNLYSQSARQQGIVPQVSFYPTQPVYYQQVSSIPIDLLQQQIYPTYQLPPFGFVYCKSDKHHKHHKK
jgi:hypothetical protein